MIAAVRLARRRRPRAQRHRCSDRGRSSDCQGSIPARSDGSGALPIVLLYVVIAPQSLEHIAGIDCGNLPDKPRREGSSGAGIATTDSHPHGPTPPLTSPFTQV